MSNPLVYPDINLFPFVIAAFAVAAPLEWGERFGISGEWQKKYVFLIVLMMLVFYWPQYSRFLAFIGQKNWKDKQQE